MGLCGLAGWFVAATVTFAAMFPPHQQLVLAYAGGGLPFALVSAILHPSWPAGLTAGAVATLLVVAGFGLVASRAPGQPNALALCFRCLGYLLGGA